MLKIDIDPTCQDYTESGHYDHDEVYDQYRAAILADTPDAVVTRELYRHGDGCVVLVVSGSDDILGRIDLDASNCTWIED